MEKLKDLGKRLYQNIILLLLIVVSSALLAGCSLSPTGLTSRTPTTQKKLEEMAKSKLLKKYGTSFEIVEKETSFFGHKNGHEDEPVYLRSYAYPTNNKDKVCFFIIDETGSFKDNYSIFGFKDDIDSYILPSFEKTGLNGKWRIDYKAIEGKIEKSKSAEDIIHDENCTITFQGWKEPSTGNQETVDLIKSWMEYLYSLDYKWYFELYDSESLSNIIFTLSPDDNHFKSVDDWSDELILSYINDIAY